MRTIREPLRDAPAPPSGVRPYRVLPFTSRSEAVRYCLKVSDALESSALAGDDPLAATLWLAAAEGRGGAVNVYACDRALAAARAAGLEVNIAGQASEAELPVARCLVIGDDRLLES